MSIRNGMPAADLPEVTWRKSRRSGPQGGNCVEVANLPDGRVAVRNFRHPAGPALVFTSAEWVAFVDQWDAKSPWHDRRVRLASSAALDRNGLNRAETLGMSRPTGGYVLWVELPKQIDSTALYHRALKEGISISPGPGSGSVVSTS